MTGWPEVTLGELCHIARGGSPRPIKSFLTNGGNGINWIKIGDATAGDGKYIASTQERIRPEGLKMSRLVEPGDFLLSNSMSFGRPYIMRTTGCIHDGWLVLRDKSHRFDPDYLYYFLGSDMAYRQFDSLAAGSTVRNLNTDLVKTVKVVLPPLEEQRRIVAVLDEAFAAIATATANAEKNLANARELFACTVEQMLERAAGCQTMTLLSAADDSCSLSYGIVQPGDEQADGLPIVRPTDLQQKYIELGPLKRIDPSLASGYQRTKLRGDELLLCVRGTTGTISIASPELSGGNVTRGIVPIRLNPAFLSQKLAYYLLLSASAQKQIKAATYGTALMQINIRDLKQLELRVPPLASQDALAGRLDAAQSYVEQLQANYSAKLDALTALKQSLLHRAFTGELTATMPETIAA